ncbi:hypothetical protein NKJ10_17840 [Mesorhizobium sp. M0204]|uniref:hypothetical protein n=1 Tax=Mesorhizobium sp. M0204 TaxID=2956913 RepID=UPI003336972F
MTDAKKIPTYRAGDIVLCKGVVKSSTHDDSVYVKFGESGECPQLMAADIERLVRPSVKVGDRVSWPSERPSCLADARRRGEVLSINHDNNAGVGEPLVWLWVKEDGKWPRATVDAKEVTRL